MCSNDKNLNICLKIDKDTIYHFDEVINEQNIINSVKNIEEQLKQNGACAKKIQDIFETVIEIMQNMLNYSYGNKDLPNNKKEAKGNFTLSYYTDTDKYIIQSCNLIDSKQEDVIKDKILVLKDLDHKELRKLARQKMRDRTDNHSKGAGLGFITIAKKVTKPIKATFVKVDENIKQFRLELEF